MLLVIDRDFLSDPILYNVTTRLVALDIEPSDLFVEALEKIWELGLVGAPLDHRLSKAQKLDLVGKLGANYIMTSDLKLTELALPKSQVREFPDRADCLVMTTSGTTGSPKFVVHQASSLESALSSSIRRLAMTSDDWSIATLPFGHVGGLGVALRSRKTRARLSILSSFDPAEIDDLAKAGANVISVVPTMVPRLSLEPFRVVLVGGANPPSGLPKNAVTTYGMTETLGGVFYDGIPLEDVELSITPTTELLIRGPMVAGYYYSEAGTQPIADDDGWFHTGDLGQVSSEGTLEIIGRASEMIVSGGENIWPSPIEEIIRQDDHILDCCVVGILDDYWGERVVAMYVPFDLHAPNLDDILNALADRLPKWCLPKEFIQIDSVPRTSLGKIQRGQLRELYSKVTSEKGGPGKSF